MIYSAETHGPASLHATLSYQASCSRSWRYL